jgi:hypothetical protein
MKSELKTLYESILGGDRASTPEQVQAELDSGVAADVILNEGMIPAMAEGNIATMAYLEGWQWGPEEERPGTAQEVVEILVAELDEAYPRNRLVDMIRGSKS